MRLLFVLTCPTQLLVTLAWVNGTKRKTHHSPHSFCSFTLMNKLYQSYDVAAGYQYQTMHVAHIHRVLTLKRGTDNLGHDSGLSFFPEEIKALNYSTYLQILSLILTFSLACSLASGCARPCKSQIFINMQRARIILLTIAFFIVAANGLTSLPACPRKIASDGLNSKLIFMSKREQVVTREELQINRRTMNGSTMLGQRKSEV